MKLLLLVAVLVASQAQAGEILRLKAVGSFKPQSIEAMTMADQKETGLYIVQWKGAVTEAQKAAVSQQGLRFLSYIPDDAFLVAGNKDAVANIAGFDFLNAVVPYHSGLKVEAALSQNGVFSFSEAVMVSVQATPETKLADMQTYFSDVRALGGGFFVGQTSVSKVWDLANSPSVIWVEKFLPLSTMELNGSDLGKLDAPTPSMPAYTGYESGNKIIHVDAAYAQGITGAGQLIAYGDTGLDSGNTSTLIADFQGQVKSAWAMGLGGSSWGDPASHGTHVAGSIAGNGAMSKGQIRGAAYEAKLVVEGLWSDILNNLSIPGIPKLFDKAYSEGARLHSNSWGAPSSNGRYDNFCVQADTWLFNNQDFLALFAAGNDGGDLNKDGVIDEGTVSSPGSAKNVLTVGASKNYLLEGGIQKTLIELRPGKEKWSVEPLASSKLSEDQRGMAAFSSRGPTADGRLKPEVVAPGTNIVSTRSRNPAAKPEDSWGQYGNDYLYMGGTSMATPITAGAMGLVRQFLLQKMGVSTVSAAMMKAAVSNTAEDLFPGQFGVRSQGQEQPKRRPNNHEGWGRVNLENLVTDNGLSFFDETRGLATGQSKEFAVDVRDTSRPLHITMAYTDAPGVASAARTLVNDLDLELQTPDGRIVYPNGGNGKDAVNNMEQIDLATPSEGHYIVRIKGANVPQGKNGAQPYALVISAGI